MNAALDSTSKNDEIEQREKSEGEEQRQPLTTSSSSCTSSSSPTSCRDESLERPSTVKVWVLASRPHTLTASIAPVLVGSSLVSLFEKSLGTKMAANPYRYYQHQFALFACLIQLGTNLHNDYADFVKGADTNERVGQARATQKGWLSPSQTAGGATVCLLLAFVIGCHLTVSFVNQNGYEVDGFMAFVTISSVFNAVAYTGGPYPLGYIGLPNLSIGYSGLGDLFVFLYFGLVATITVPYLYLRSSGNTRSIAQLLFYSIFGNIPTDASNDNNSNDDGESSMTCSSSLEQKQLLLFRASVLLALPIAFLATAIIVVNNLRDRNTDVHAGKKTLAVRFGESFARTEYAMLILGSYFILPLLAIDPSFQSLTVNHSTSNSNSNSNSTFAVALLYPLLTIPLAMEEFKAVARGGKDGAALNVHVGRTARLQFLFCLLLVVGFKSSCC